jgi:hypothetical protein
MQNRWWDKIRGLTIFSADTERHEHMRFEPSNGLPARPGLFAKPSGNLPMMESVTNCGDP